MKRVLAAAAALMIALAATITGFLVFSPATPAAHAVTAARMARPAEPGFMTRLQPRSYLLTVRPGDTLTGLAVFWCHRAVDWTGLYRENRTVIGGDPDLILIGQHLTLSRCTQAVVQAVQTKPAYRETYKAPAATYQAPATYQGSGAMQVCIIARESGGNSQVMNSTGHYGLYQFSASTWAAHGGNPADFGHASVAEQNQVYYNTVAADGYSDWAPYDGC